MFKESLLFSTIFTFGLFTLASFPAQAAFHIHSPQIEKGVFEIESQNAFKYNDNGDDERQHKVELRYGFTPWWALALEGEWEKEGSDNYEYTATGIENYFQFTASGQHFLDAGAILGYEFAHPSGADKIGGQLLIEKNFTNFSHTANLIVEQDVGDNANDNPEWELAWRSIYLYKPMLNPGFEYYAGFNEIGNSGDFDDQSHHLGPFITGKLGHGFGYDIGWLIGLSNGSADHVVKFNLEYEFPL